VEDALGEPSTKSRQNRAGFVTPAFYNSEGVAEDYAEVSGLRMPEQVLVNEAIRHIEGQPVLDIGVGAGRTTGYLRGIAARYVAIDFSERMLWHCRRNHAGVCLALCDARAICFADGSFQMAGFFYNGLDDVEHVDRLLIFREVRRVLRPGGVFLFSSHNLDSDGAENVPRERGFAIVQQSYEPYTLPTYYISRERQVRQLAGCGFGETRVLDEGGRPVGPGERCRDRYLYYSTRKRPA